jgi:hypothetical protein
MTLLLLMFCMRMASERCCATEAPREGSKGTDAPCPVSQVGPVAGQVLSVPFLQLLSIHYVSIERLHRLDFSHSSRSQLHLPNQLSRAHHVLIVEESPSVKLPLKKLRLAMTTLATP